MCLSFRIASTSRSTSSTTSVLVEATQEFPSAHYRTTKREHAKLSGVRVSTRDIWSARYGARSDLYTAATFNGKPQQDPRMVHQQKGAPSSPPRTGRSPRFSIWGTRRLGSSKFCMNRNERRCSRHRRCHHNQWRSNPFSPRASGAAPDGGVLALICIYNHEWLGSGPGKIVHAALLPSVGWTGHDPGKHKGGSRINGLPKRTLAT